MRPEDSVTELIADQEAFEQLKRADAIHKVNQRVTDTMVDALETILNLAVHGSNERLRFDAAKYILERGMPVQTDNGPLNPIDRLMDEIIDEINNAPMPN